MIDKVRKSSNITFGPLDTVPSPHLSLLSSSLSGTEMGAERAENRVSGREAVSGGYRDRHERCADISLLTIHSRLSAHPQLGLGY